MDIEHPIGFGIVLGILITLIVFGTFVNIAMKNECRMASNQGALVVYLDRQFMEFDPYCLVREEIGGEIVEMSPTSWLEYRRTK